MEDKFVKKVYREFLKEIVDDPVVRDEKRQFLREHFEPAEARLGFWGFVPAACTLALFFVLVLSQMPYTLHEAPPVVEPKIEESVLRPAMEVKRSTSRVGQIMVYQKSYQERPITIIWVFPS